LIDFIFIFEGMKSMIIWASLVCLGNVFAQNFGINAPNPSATLDIQTFGNNAGSNAITVTNSQNDTLFLLRNDGRLGIGTTAPSAPLEIQTNGAIAARFSAPVEGQPAINANELVTLGQLQTVSAGGQAAGSTGSNATDWSSTFSSTTLTLFDAMRFCRNLTDGGHNDWRLPHFNDIYTLFSNSAVPLPTLNATGTYWLSATDMTYLNNSSGFWPAISVSSTNLNTNGSVSFTITYYYNSNRTVCVR
jgi:hypothetical protein